MAREGPRALLVAAQPVAGAAGWLRSCRRPRGKAMDRQLAASPSAHGVHACHVPRAARACRVHSCTCERATRCTVPTYRDKHTARPVGTQRLRRRCEGCELVPRVRVKHACHSRLISVKEASLVPLQPCACTRLRRATMLRPSTRHAVRCGVRAHSYAGLGSTFPSHRRPDLQHTWQRAAPTPPHCTHVAADLRT